MLAVDIPRLLDLTSRVRGHQLSMLICVVFYIEFHCVIVYSKRMNERMESAVVNNILWCDQQLFVRRLCFCRFNYNTLYKSYFLFLAVSTDRTTLL
jgi:hypothetical protein